MKRLHHFNRSPDGLEYECYFNGDFEKTIARMYSLRENDPFQTSLPCFVLSEKEEK